MGAFACYALRLTAGAAAFGSPAGRGSLGVEWMAAAAAALPQGRAGSLLAC